MGQHVSWYEYHVLFLLLFYLSFNVKHTKQLLLDIQQIPFDGEIKFASFKITSMYTIVQHKKVSHSLVQMVDTVDIIFTTCKGEHLDALEIDHVYQKMEI
jgi:hypothetical protein